MDSVPPSFVVDAAVDAEPVLFAIVFLPGGY